MDLVQQVEALRPHPLEARADLDLTGLAQLRAEVDLDAREDEVAEAAEDADARLLEVRRVDGVVHVADGVAIAEAHALPMNERKLGHGPGREAAP